MKKRKTPRSYKDIVNVPKNLKQELPTSYDIVGDIVLIKLRNNLLSNKKEIAKALLTAHRNIKTVCLITPVSGELRTRKIEIIGGEKRTETIHKEFGLIFQLDISKVYFSTRLSSERKRITNLVNNNEIIVDMFTGVGPFSIMIAKYANPKIIYALDKNSNAIKYAKKNVTKNNVLDKVEVIHANSKEIEKIIKVKANRILMNLPFSSHLFFSNALKIMNNICIIHYYDILNINDLEQRINYLKEIAIDNNVILTGFNVRRIKSYTPREFYIGIDITAKRYMPM
jgi:tRNA (guanine37-N1)-methyltransferase